MKSIATQLESLFKDALVCVMGNEGRTVDPLIRVAGEKKFGDYQSNVAMSLAKQLKQKPREVAQQIVDALGPVSAEMCEPMKIAGPGFINIRLKIDWLAARLNDIPLPGGDDRLGIDPVAKAQNVVVDYSGPNIAKQMHVGHLRSTIIGDAIARVLEFEGHHAIRQNHLGDWGTQFGMLCAHLKEKMPDAIQQGGEVHLADLEAFYKEANVRDKEDQAFQERARAEVVALHRHEPETIRAWQYIVNESRNHYMPIYQRLGVSLTQEHERGESFYADQLGTTVEGLKAQFGVDRTDTVAADANGASMRVEESDGALCVFHHTAQGEPMFKNRQGDPLPMIIRKSDGAFLYATTDLTAMKYRIEELLADRVIYVTDARQEQHFEMVFATVQIAGWTRGRAGSPDVRLDHVTFGSILGEDRRPLKTRSGENVKLADLLDEAVARAEGLVRANEEDPDKSRGFSEAQIKDIAEAVGVGAVKYADLSQNRQSDYLFSWDKMLAMEGNTGPYLMYAYARIRSIYRKAAQTAVSPKAGQIVLGDPTERALARQILRLAETLEGVVTGLKINLLTDYLYELAGRFMKFYETCPVLRAETDTARVSRLALCDLTARTLRLGLGLLGIRVLEQM